MATTNNYTAARIVFIIAAVFEAVFAIPVIGWGLAWSFLGIASLLGLGLHIVALSMARDGQFRIIAPILGIVAALTALIPIIGWFFHLCAAAVYIGALSNDKGLKEVIRDTILEMKSDSKIKDAEIVEDKTDK